MWVVSSNGLNTGVDDKPCAIATIVGEDKAFPLCVTAIALSGGNRIANKVIDVVLTSPEPIDGRIEISVPTDREVVKVEVGGVGYVPSPTPDSPQPGEFIIQDNKIIVTVKGRSPTAGMNLVVKTEPQALRTDYVNPSLFQVFAGLPVIATVNWTRSLEQHPSGSANLSVLRSGIITVRSRFRKGNEIEFAGIGFSVSGYSERLLNTHEYPGGLYEVSVSFTGKWNRPKYNRPVLYKGGAGTITGEDNSKPVVQDPDCINPKPPGG
jgi:hypothetical protein